MTYVGLILPQPKLGENSYTIICKEGALCAMGQIAREPAIITVLM
jgi:hypothetical protein